MVGFDTNKMIPIPEDIIKNKSFLNSEYICHCPYCLIELKNIQSLRSHFRTCTKRLLMRYYICNNYIFGLYCNPGLYLESIAEEIKVSSDAKLLMGCIRAFMFSKKIRGMFVMEVKNTKNELYKNGRIMYKEIKIKLTPEQILQIEKERSVIIQSVKDKVEV